MRQSIEKKWKTFVKNIILLAVICSISGCASLIARPSKVILLPEERIFTIPSGQKIDVLLDKKPMSMTFPEDMKLVSPTVLVRQEEKLNNAVLSKAKSDGEKKKALGIVGSILAILAAGLGIYFKMKKWLPNIKGNIEIK